jgi:hypothetical protein
LLNIYYKRRTTTQLAITKTIITLTIYCYTTLPIPITTAMPIIVLKYRRTTSLYYKVSVDRNNLITRRISI